MSKRPEIPSLEKSFSGMPASEVLKLFRKSSSYRKRKDDVVVSPEVVVTQSPEVSRPQTARYVPTSSLVGERELEILPSPRTFRRHVPMPPKEDPIKSAFARYDEQHGRFVRSGRQVVVKPEDPSDNVVDLRPKPPKEKMTPERAFLKLWSERYAGDKSKDGSNTVR